MDDKVIYIKKIFRYRFSSLCILICIIFSCIGMYFGVVFTRNALDEMKDNEKFRYNSETNFGVVSDFFFDDLEKISDKKVNLLVTGLEIINDTSNETHLVDCIISIYDSKLPVSNEILKEGLGEKAVVLGRNNEKNIIEENGEKYYLVFGEKYKVLAFLETTDSGIYDDSEFLFYNPHIANYIKQSLSDGQQINLCLESDVVDTGKVYQEMFSGKNAFLDVSTSFTKDTNKPFMYEDWIAILIVIFCNINIAFMTKFWIDQRKEEIGILSIFGYSKKMIRKKILYEFLFLIVLGDLISVFLILLIYKLITELIIDYHLYFNLKNFIYTLLAIVAVATGVFLPVLEKFLRMKFKEFKR